MLVVWLLFANSFTFVSGQSSILNTQCQVARIRTPGVCRFVQNCQTVLSEVLNEFEQPSECGYENHTLVVCCPLSATPKLTTTQSPDIKKRISAESNQ